VGTLYLVATPIGNLEDISIRAVNILKQVHWIAAEDTRRTKKLLKHYDIQTPVISFHEHSKRRKLEYLLDQLSGGDLALVSDAGTPLLNDPGYVLVREALQAGHEVSPIPGPSAPIAALVASGLPTDRFLYLGYLPRKSRQRQQLLFEVADLEYTLIFLETPHRLLDSLGDLYRELGERWLVVARELTKLHEEFFRGPISTALAHYEANPPRGEITLILAGHTPQDEIWTEERLLAELNTLKLQDQSPAQIASQLARQSGWPRREIYQLIINLE
jgi:16S rRNA (cytidine1402-2'-O)-methyltransferase